LASERRCAALCYNFTAVPPILAPGSKLGQYRILSLLGKGGMGEVYLAEHSRLGRRVALKLLPEAATREGDRLRRFEQEARAASALNHPNILTVYEISELNHIHFLATEYIDGETLRRQIPPSGMPLHQALDLAVQVVGALIAAHANGIVHRDIKPENIMLRRDGYVKVLDFGLAKLQAAPVASLDGEAPTLDVATTNAGTIVGTPEYMSPEQARGARVDERTDIFSAGVLLYEMIAGQSPFRGATVTDSMVSLLQKEPPLLAQLVPDVPVELDRIVSKALAKDCEERYQTAKDLLIDLKRVKHHLEIDREVKRSAQSIPKSALSWSPFRNSSRKAVGFTALSVISVAIAFTAYLASRPPKIGSIAVLPFVNVTRDPNTEYLSDGITEGLIDNLGLLPNMIVRSRDSAFRYKGKDLNIREAGETLKVQAVLMGRVAQRGNNISIDTELVDTRNDRHIWGKQYGRKLADVMAVQQEIAGDLSNILRGGLSAEERQKIAARSTHNPEAYQLYLQGRYQGNRFTEDGARKAIQSFQEAITRDPSYAEAYAGLADAYTSFSDIYFPPLEIGPKAKEAAQRALALDETLAEAHSTLGTICYAYDWDLAAAGRELRRAIELNPNYALAHNQYGWALMLSGRLEQAEPELGRALQLEPLSLVFMVDTIVPKYVRRQFNQSIPKLRKLVETEPNSVYVHSALGLNLLISGRARESIPEFERVRQIDDQPNTIAYLVWAYSATGLRDKARTMLAHLQEKAYVPALSQFYAHVGLGEKEQALKWLEMARDERSTNLPFISIDPALDSLRSEPRFQAVLRQFNLP